VTATVILFSPRCVIIIIIIIIIILCVNITNSNTSSDSASAVEFRSTTRRISVLIFQAFNQVTLRGVCVQNIYMSLQ